MDITTMALHLRFNFLLQFIVYVVLFINLLRIQTSEVQAAPIKITLDTLKNCRNGTMFGSSAVFPSCCPAPDVDLNVQVVDFVPKGKGSRRIRKALQCLSDEELRKYTKKLTRGYELMRNLPVSDPRSLTQQRRIHCAYCTGSFSHDGLSFADNFTIDIHFNWLFLPWHRMFLLFHERILQKLLHDDSFSLHFWNFDNGVDATNSTEGESEGCFKPGHFIPEIYNDNSTSTFESDRSNRTLIPDIIADLSIPATDPLADIPVRYADEVVPRNRESMQYGMATGTVPTDFFGVTFKYGDVRTNYKNAGSMEMQPHSSMHRWLGGAMVLANTSAFDPIFYTFHANFDRLWNIWMTIGDNAELQPTDSDWLDVEFLLWDENKVLRRVSISDLLSIDNLGYSYETVNDAFWM